MAGRIAGRYLILGPRKWRRLQLSLAVAVHDVLAGSDGQGHHGQGGILAAAADERGSVGDEEVLNIVRLIELVEYGGSRVVAHARRPCFMDGEARHGCSPVKLDLRRTSRLEHLGALVSAVFEQLELAIAPFHVDAQDWDAPSVNAMLVDLDVVFVARPPKTRIRIQWKGFSGGVVSAGNLLIFVDLGGLGLVLLPNVRSRQTC